VVGGLLGGEWDYEGLGLQRVRLLGQYLAVDLIGIEVVG
jgi:hypothetical protein